LDDVFGAVMFTADMDDTIVFSAFFGVVIPTKAET
jgi:hypothetical protein